MLIHTVAVVGISNIINRLVSHHKRKVGTYGRSYVNIIITLALPISVHCHQVLEIFSFYFKIFLYFYTSLNSSKSPLFTFYIK